MVLPAHEKHYILETIKRLYDYVESLPTKQDCATCKHFDCMTKRCDINEHRVVPDHVQRTGCECWLWDRVPF